jgi:LDH2 family malate/lactate/ureidoglycolate dehydrogenase
MNRPPTEFSLIAANALREHVQLIFQHVGMPATHAGLLAHLLTTNDLRGVVSHGTRQAVAYVGHFRAGRLTPAAEIATISETPSTLVLDGGGGLGYFPCHEAATRLAEKSKTSGIAVATTRNHGHFGAAGIYARIIVAQDQFAYITSGHQLNLLPGGFVMGAAGGSPMAFGIPAGDEPPFLLDFGAIHDMYLGLEGMRPIVEMVPSTVLRSFGLGCACQALGGFLCGVPVDPQRAERSWPGADQGSMMIAVDLNLLYPLGQFKHEMDEYARKVREMTPLPGIDRALLPGAIELENEQAYSQSGIPLSLQHAEALRKLGQDLGLDCPF